MTCEGDKVKANNIDQKIAKIGVTQNFSLFFVLLFIFDFLGNIIVPAHTMKVSLI